MEQPVKNQEDMSYLQSKTHLTITEAAKLQSVTRQAIYIAIRQKKLKATKEDTTWKIHKDDLEFYRKGKYSRSKSTYMGELIFDGEKGFFSIGQVAKMLSVPSQKIYYATRIGKLKASRKRASWVIHMDDVEAYKKEHLETKKQMVVNSLEDQSEEVSSCCNGGCCSLPPIPESCDLI